jgi:RNA:NAD 2'-phosphotransferase (TPT1/KptA family)
MEKMKYARLSKLIEQVIRQQACDSGPEMNREGYVSLEGLINIVAWKSGCSPADILAALEQGGQTRFEVCGEMIRARAGDAKARVVTAGL